MLSDSDENDLIDPQAPDVVRCDNLIDTVSQNQGIDLKKLWKCPSGSLGRYVFLHFANPLRDMELCEVEVYAGGASSSSTQGGGYSKSWCHILGTILLVW